MILKVYLCHIYTESHRFVKWETRTENERERARTSSMCSTLFTISRNIWFSKMLYNAIVVHTHTHTKFKQNPISFHFILLFICTTEKSARSSIFESFSNSFQWAILCWKRSFRLTGPLATNQFHMRKKSSPLIACSSIAELFHFHHMTCLSCMICCCEKEWNLNTTIEK